MEIYEIIGRLLGGVLVCLLAYITPKVKRWLESNVDKNNVDKIMAFIDSFVRAADQLYHDNDPTGEKRNAYVKKQLEAMGVVISESVISMIEGAVFNVNVERKSVIVPAEFDTVMTTGYIAPANEKTTIVTNTVETPSKTTKTSKTKKAAVEKK